MRVFALLLCVNWQYRAVAVSPKPRDKDFSDCRK